MMMVAKNDSSSAVPDIIFYDLDDHQTVINHKHVTKIKVGAANDFKTASKAAAYLFATMIFGCYIGGCFEPSINQINDQKVAGDTLKMVAKRGQQRQLRDTKIDPKTIKYKEHPESVNEMIGTNSKPTATNFYPFVINVGQGTTATRALYSATCLLNLTTFHYGSFCLPKNEVQTPEDLTTEQQDALISHFEILDTYKHWHRTCLASDIDGMSKEVIQSCSIQTTISQMEQMKYRLRTLIQSGAVHALMDSPYPNVAQYIIEEYKRVHGKEPIVIMSERDPYKWIRKRIQDHPGDELFCRASIFDSDQFWSDYNQEPFDPFDFDRCLRKALENKENLPAKYSDVFTNHALSIAEASKESKDNTAAIEEREASILQRMERVMDAAQSYYRQISNYHVDLFALEERIGVQEIAAHIKQSIILAAKNNEQVLFPSPSGGMQVRSGNKGGFMLKEVRESRQEKGYGLGPTSAS